MLQSRLGVHLGEDVVETGPGQCVFKPRGRWHIFWNASKKAREIIEVISPSDFEDCSREVAAAWSDGPDFAGIKEKHALGWRFDSMLDLCKRFGLTFPDFPAS
ncbi:MAG: hypothetical protein SNJ52_00145 [Verrucomicrobiia bacterium]